MSDENDGNSSKQKVKVVKKSMIKNFGKMIRSSLPKIGNHLRQLLRLTITRELNTEGEIDDVEITDSDESITVDVNNAFLFDSSSMDDTSSNRSHNLSISIRPSNLLQFYSTDNPSTSTTSRPINPMESNMTISTIYSSPTNPSPLMISHSVNVMQDVTVTSVVNEEGAIIAGNPSDFVATLHIHTGSENDEEINIEPRRIPLYMTNENRNYINSSRFDDNLSSGSGSSSESGLLDDFREQNSLIRRRRNETRQLYDVAMRQTVRKQFLHLDDEPPIY